MKTKTHNSYSEVELSHKGWETKGKIFKVAGMFHWEYSLGRYPSPVKGEEKTMIAAIESMETSYKRNV